MIFKLFSLLSIQQTYCQAWLMLVSDQISKYKSQSLNSETKGAELTLKSHCTTNPPTTTNFSKMVKRWFLISFQLTLSPLSFLMLKTQPKLTNPILDWLLFQKYPRL